MERRKRVGLFKAVSTKDEGGDNDPYCSALASIGLSPVVIPTLQFNFVNMSLLKEILAGIGDGYSALALTSPRAVEAVERAMPTGDRLGNDVKVFAVGRKTADAAKRSLKCRIEGEEEECGTSEAMAELVAQRLGKRKCKVLLMDV